jgi:hypothetical protein
MKSLQTRIEKLEKTQPGIDLAAAIKAARERVRGLPAWTADEIRERAAYVRRILRGQA